MINLKNVALSSNFAQNYTVHRKSGAWHQGKFTQTETSLARRGAVTNASPKELMQVPEGDRVAGMMVFYSDQPLYTTHGWKADDTNEQGTSDEIEWPVSSGSKYKVLTVYDYHAQGFYKVFAVYMEGD